MSISVFRAELQGVPGAERMTMSYGDLQWAATGERLTAETFGKYRKTGGLVAVFNMPIPVVDATVASPLTIIASDGILENGKGHPRASGTFCRVLGRYVREKRALTLMDALRKMTVMPADRLVRRVPSMSRKGRLAVGADADVVVFDPARIADRATYRSPAEPSVGVRFLLVSGTVVVEEGRVVEGVFPGRGLVSDGSSKP